MSLGKGLESLLPQNNNQENNFTQINGENQNAASSQVNGNNNNGNVNATLIIDSEVNESASGNISETKKEVLSVSEERNIINKGREYIFQLEIEKIKFNPYQPRKEFNEAAIKELASSIREYGILEPLIVSKIEVDLENGRDVYYELIAGHRRLLAAKLAGLERVPAIIKDVNQKQGKLELAIIENVQRENLNPIELARAYSRLSEEFSLTQREIASRLGKSREAIANTMRLLSLPPYIQEEIIKGNLSESHARLLMMVDDPAAQEMLFKEIIKNNLPVSELKKKVNLRQNKRQKEKNAELIMAERELSKRLQAPVSVELTSNGGKITIHFYSVEELNKILNLVPNDNEEEG